jgi:hypothetical protein
VSAVLTNTLSRYQHFKAFLANPINQLPLVQRIVQHFWSIFPDRRNVVARSDSISNGNARS